MAQWFTNLTRNHEFVGSIPDLAQWVNDLALMGTVAKVADVSQILCCCGSGVDWWLQF